MKNKFLYLSSLALLLTLSSCGGSNTSESENPSINNNSEMTSEVVSNSEFESTEVSEEVNSSEEIVKVKPVITFSIESGAEITDASQLTYTISHGATGTHRYEKDEMFHSYDFPTEYGIYALVVEVEESEKYEYSKNWVVFSYVSTLPEADIEFTTKTVYDYTGEGIRPDFGVTPGVEYTYHYEQNGVYYQDDDPVEVGDYTLVVITKENESYRETKRWFNFSIVNSNRVDAEVTFSIENGDTVVSGTEITFNAPSDATYTYWYSANDGATNLGTTAPVEPGIYALNVQVEQSDTYNEKHYFVWYKLISGEKITPVIEFDTSTIYPTFTVSDNAPYTVHYEQNEQFYSNERPTEYGTYTMVVTVTEDDTYNGVVAWVVFELEDPDNVKVTPVVTFSIEAGAEVAPGAPITYTVSNGLVGTAQFDKDEVFYCAYEGVAPTEPGTYALVVNVAETETTKALVTWVLFTVVA